MNILVIAIFLIVTSLLGISTVSSALGDENEERVYSTYARPINRKPADYPRRAQQRGQEGWVDVSYVVKSDGTVDDPIVEDSSGIGDFEAAAIKAVQQWTFEPATMNGKPIEQCHTQVRLTFAFEGDELLATRNFIRRHKRAQKKIEERDFETANSIIDETMELGKWNLYEYARLWFLKAQVAQGLEDEARMLSALYRAMGSDGDYIEDSLYRNLLPLRLQTELRLAKYSAALDTYKKMEQFPDLLDENEMLTTAVAELLDNIEGGQPISVPAKIAACSDCGGVWSYRPLRREFAFYDVDGELTELDLRCDWKRFRDDPEKEASWRIPASWGDCRLYVYGAVGTTFKFVEFADDSASAAIP